METLQQLIDGLNGKYITAVDIHTTLFPSLFSVSCLPSIPEKGTVGASGDLGPLAHLVLGFMGEGEMWGPKTGWGNAQEVHNSISITLIWYL